MSETDPCNASAVFINQLSSFFLVLGEGRCDDLLSLNYDASIGFYIAPNLSAHDLMRDGAWRSLEDGRTQHDVRYLLARAIKTCGKSLTWLVDLNLHLLASSKLSSPILYLLPSGIQTLLWRLLLLTLVWLIQWLVWEGRSWKPRNAKRFRWWGSCCTWVTTGWKLWLRVIDWEPLIGGLRRDNAEPLVLLCCHFGLLSVFVFY